MFRFFAKSLLKDPIFLTATVTSAAATHFIGSEILDKRQDARIEKENEEVIKNFQQDMRAIKP